MASFGSCALLGVGNPLLDISANVPADMLTKYGVSSGDIILAEEKHMGVFAELVEKHGPVDYIAGGATQNSIRVAAWMTGKKVPMAFAGCVGDDENGKILAARCAEAGVVAHYLVDKATPTGKCAVLVVDSERCLITDLQAANNYTAAHLQEAATQKLLNDAKIVYSAGFFLTSGGPTCTAILGKHCAATGARFCLNISAPFIAQFFTDALDATLPYVDIIFGNETEAAALGEKKGWGTDPATVALKLAALPKTSGTHKRMAVITQGAEPTVVAVDGVVKYFPVPPLAKELLIDTNGAGDAFVGGFLSQILEGAADLDLCCKAGNFAARTVIQRSGCTTPETCDFSA